MQSRVVIFVAALQLASCSEPALVVDIPFRAALDGASIGCQTSSDDLTLTDLRFYVSDVQLLRRDGQRVPLSVSPRGRWQSDDVTLIDLEDGSGACANGTPDANHRLVGRAPAGDYTGLIFTVGVPFDHNHADPLTAAPPLDDSTMHWHWRSGYKFLRIGWTTGNGGFWLHLGSAACKGTVQNITGCRHPNRVDVVLDSYQPGDGVVIDLRALVDSVEDSTSAADSCSSGPAEDSCAAPFSVLGIAASADAQFVAQTVFQRDL